MRRGPSSRAPSRCDPDSGPKSAQHSTRQSERGCRGERHGYVVVDPPGQCLREGSHRGSRNSRTRPGQGPENPGGDQPEGGGAQEATGPETLLAISPSEPARSGVGQREHQDPGLREGTRKQDEGSYDPRKIPGRGCDPLPLPRGGKVGEHPKEEAVEARLPEASQIACKGDGAQDAQNDDRCPRVNAREPEYGPDHETICRMEEAAAWLRTGRGFDEQIQRVLRGIWRRIAFQRVQRHAPVAEGLDVSPVHMAPGKSRRKGPVNVPCLDDMFDEVQAFDRGGVAQVGSH